MGTQLDLDDVASGNPVAQAELADLRRQLSELRGTDNPFGCGHAKRFIWRDPAGGKACAACRMFIAERLEREENELRARLAEYEMLHSKCSDCGKTMNFIGRGLYECWYCTHSDFRANVSDALAEIRGVIIAHDIRLESCDRDGQEFCDCLDRVMAKTAKLGLAESEETK